MKRLLSWFSTLGLVALATIPANASRAVIPDHYPTIQAAIDSGPDTIAVRDGVAPERLSVWRHVVIEPASLGFDLLPSWESAPAIRSMRIWKGCEPSYCGISLGVSVRGMRILGEIQSEWMPNALLEFEGCRLDSGFSAPLVSGDYSMRYRLQGCLIVSKVAMQGYVQFTGNTVIGGEVSIGADGLHDIRHNYIQGPADAGLILRLQSSHGPVGFNTIRGTTHGIVFEGHFFATEGNDISDCKGDGIFYDHGMGTTLFLSNTITRCGGAGIRVRSLYGEAGHVSAELSGNRIRDTGGAGIDLGDSYQAELRDNIVLDSGGDGVVARNLMVFIGNVVGRSTGSGVRVTESLHEFASNTIFSNGAAGLRMEINAAASRIEKSIFAFNRGMGLKYEDEYVPEFSCNDWFGNGMGGVVGTEADSSDLSVDPLFCDLAAGDVHLAANSPLLTHPTCGRIGALGQGCDALAPTTSVAGAAGNLGSVLRAFPNPATSGVAFSLVSSSVPADLEIFDVSGARRWFARIPGGRASLDWDRRDSDGISVPPGVYFARLKRGGQEVARVSVVLTD